MEGIQTPLVYIGGPLSSFSWHVEDGNLNAINYLHHGQPKFWYIIDKDDSLKFEDLASKIIGIKRKCDLYLRHKTLMIPPSVLKTHGIKFTRVVQKPGNFMITFSNVYHSGFNLGLNKAESINFGAENWMKMFEKYKTCSCEFSSTNTAPNQAIENLRKIFELQRTEYVCKKCHKKFVSRENLEVHITKNHKKHQEIFQCSKCHVKCTTPYTLRCHMRDEHGKYLEIAEAKKCAVSVTVSTKVSAIEKKKIIKNKQKKENTEFICKVCGKLFSRLFNLQRHERDYNHLLPEEMASSTETVTEMDLPCRNSIISVENRNVFAPNIAISEEIVGSNCHDKMQTKTAKSKKGKAEQQTFDNGQNEPEPGSSKVDKKKGNAKKKNVEPAKKRVFKAKARSDLKKPASEEPIKSEKLVNGKAKKAETAKSNTKASKSKQIAEKSADQIDDIKENATTAAKGRKRAAPTVSTLTEKSPVKKDKKDTTATSTAASSKAKDNGTYNKKRKTGVKAALDSTTDEPNDGLVNRTKEGPEYDVDADSKMDSTEYDLSQIAFDTGKDLMLNIVPVNTAVLRVMVDKNLVKDAHEAPVEANGNAAKEKGQCTANGTAPVVASVKSVKNEPCRKTIQIIPALPLKTKLPRIPKILHQNIAEDPLTPNFERLKMKDLLTYEIPDDIRSIEFDNNTEKLNYLKSVVQEARTKEISYIDAFTAMIQLEEAANSKFMKKFDIEDVRLDLCSRENQIFRIRFDPNKQNFQKACNESLLDGFTVKPFGSEQNLCSGHIVQCREDSIYVQITQSFEEILEYYGKEYQLFTLNFFTNRLMYKVLLNTLDWIKKHKLHAVLVNNELYDQVDYSIPDKRDNQNNFKCSISGVLNEEQKSAVQQIVWGENDKIPILLHGPPGTGKTFTLVASIAEIVEGTTDHVLVLAHSNAACDELTIRLTEVLRRGELYRLYAKSFNKEMLCDKIKPICNLKDGEFQLPALKYLYRFRVVVSTLSISGSLVRAREEDQDFNSSHFRRVIIDEAGCAHEPATMIPIAGLCSENGVVNTRIVLSGDPKQLDAVTKSVNAEKLGFKTSWMEYLMENKKCYMRHPILKRHDPKFITVLTKNYRCHPDILAIPNKLFYDGILEAEAKIDEKHGIIANQLLPNSNFPLVFESVNGECDQESGDTSCFNEEEVCMVIKWIRKLSKTEWKGNKISTSDIGVVSPYKKQCALIRNELSNNGFEDVTVGTAEVYQGKEKQIIIISTVRTGKPLGFITNEQRINVMITRAIGLLIIVGNHEALEDDSNWAALIEYCNKNGALIREKRILHPRIKAPE